MSNVPSSGPRPDWSAVQYLKFEDERTRPARDLFAQVPIERPRRIVDLGCGPGNSTALLAARWPEAEVWGIDTSPDMLEAAQARLPNVRFEQADAASWEPALPVDVIFANALFQWLPDHVTVMVRLVQHLAPDGVLAVQMPDNLTEPTHRLMSETARAMPFADKMDGAARVPLPSPARYYEALHAFSAKLDIWHTIYNHPLDGAQAIVEWMKSTGLKPFLDPLQEKEREVFLQTYRHRIAEAYPPMSDGKVLLRFPRLFVVAARK